ncbi:MAG TPA: hypothetical protein VHV78_00820, partial [Gemmatimonadaceae bacterium]|nr:hypothetical protein [Gemmatimonadaceae bacterium]
MSRFRYRDDEPSSTTTVLGVLLGAAAGFAIGMVVAQRVGGLSGLKGKLRRRRSKLENGATPPEIEAGAAEFDDDEDDLEPDSYDEVLEDRVLEAFRNDP